MSAKMTPRELRQLNDEVAEKFGQLGVELPGGGDFFERPGWQLALVAATGTAARAAEAKAAALRRRSDRLGDDPMRADYLLDNDDQSPIVEDDDADWSDGGDAAAASVDRYFPSKRKPADAPRGKQEAADGPKKSPMERLLRTSDSSGGPDHEPAERKPSSALSKFLERRKK